ncbi:MAG TPA: Asp23/Gls24 family envelope stress response protein, partial [Clostridiales bacterium]|nr:Asp23/Gls24 family envelope stress response protein [Clostridiales bacterium]
GRVNISEEVLTAIAGAAAMEVEGVESIGSGLGNDVAAMVNRKTLSKGVRLSVEDDQVRVNIIIMVQFGYVVPDVARAVQEAIISGVENTSGLQVNEVNVTVTGVSFPQ